MKKIEEVEFRFNCGMRHKVYNPIDVQTLEAENKALQDKLDIAITYISKVEELTNQPFETEKDMKDSLFSIWVYSRETLAELKDKDGGK